MSRIEKQRPLPTDEKNGFHAPESETSAPDPRLLNRFDWMATALLALVLVVTPLWAGTFSAIPLSGSYPVGNPFGFTGTGGFPLALALIAAAALLTVWREWKRPVAIGAIPGLAGACVLIAGWAVLSLAHSFTLAVSLNALALLLGSLVLGGLVSRLARDRNGLFALLGATLLGGTLVATFGLREYIETYKMHDYAHRTFSSFANPDFLAGYLLLLLPVTLSGFVAAKEKMMRLLLGLGLAFQSGCLLLTGSRSGVGMMLIALAVWLGLVAFSGGLRRNGKAIALGFAVFGLGAVIGMAPTLSRFQGQVKVTDRQTGQVKKVSVAEAQGNSGQFRRWTWNGTVRMALANPIFGTGIGTFETAYPRYAETAFTAHAHNGYLQWLGEMGLPGGLFLLAALAASTAFATHTLRLQRIRPENAPADTGSDGALFGDLSLLLAGMLAGVMAALLHNLFDSDLYITGTALTFAAITALMVALARDLAPLGTQTPRPLGREMLGFSLLVALFLFWRSSATMGVRLNIATGEEAVSAEAAAEAYHAAAAADPLDGDPHLMLAQAAQMQRNAEAARSELTAAVRLAPTGKALYRLGQFYAATGDSADALIYLERARSREPRNLQTLHLLAKTLQEAGKTGQAIAIYRQMTALETTPYGTVRAMPELVETEFAYAHAALGDLATDAGQREEAAREYQAADTVMKEYWEKRKLDANLSRTPQKRADLLRLYETIFTRWQETLKTLNRTQEAAHVADQQAVFHTERDADQAEADRAAQQSPPAP